MQERAGDIEHQFNVLPNAVKTANTILMPHGRDSLNRLTVEPVFRALRSWY